jgi:hypothetical protein
MTAQTRAASVQVVNVRDELLSLTVRMGEEYSEFPAGSVMRCVARSIRQAHRAGVPRETLPAEAERRARQVLDGRTPLAQRTQAS